jgi:hypothetical protein
LAISSLSRGKTMISLLQTYCMFKASLMGENQETSSSKRIHLVN